ncbi:hypothetical protein HRW13_13165 [Streptomyces lunaelactis]|uniref:hypothetical protein n=1 Tax=Streptomyces lunaelactis TaxID=1535768 RepID=UPI001585C720|nr:hypothetical protein [Streptomyces lunaelactis]NUK41814.1 hypothetical protein [Streptomyces lunaelactis]
MAPTDPSTRIALEAARHEEQKQIAMIDTLHVSATALLGFEGAAIALLNADNGWDKAALGFLFASIMLLILNVLGVNMSKKWRRGPVGFIARARIYHWYNWSKDTLEDHLFITTMNILLSNEDEQVKGRRRTLAWAVAALAGAAISKIVSAASS